MVTGEVLKLDNLIKWILRTRNTCDIIEVSQSFAIQDRKCAFLYYYGYSISNPQKPVTLSINFNEKVKLTQPVDVIILVSSTSKNFPTEKHTVTGEQQVIWSSLDYDMLRGTLLTFEMVIYNGGVIPKDDKSVQALPCIYNSVLLEDLSKDFDKLFQEGIDYDVEFICDDEKIKAHKNILSSRSSVFASMLRTDMKEGNIGQVKIEDMECDILRQFLRCLYVGKLPELTVDKALLFYEAADKYAVHSLKKQCANYLMNNASPENACKILLIADRHSDPDFKRSVIDYMIKVEVPIIGEKWTDFCKENSFLATEVLNLYCRHLRQK